MGRQFTGCLRRDNTTPQPTLNPLETTCDKLCNPPIYIPQGTTEEPNPRLQVPKTATAAHIGWHMHRMATALQSKRVPKGTLLDT